MKPCPPFRSRPSAPMRPRRYLAAHQSKGAWSGTTQVPAMPHPYSPTPSLIVQDSVQSQSSLSPFPLYCPLPLSLPRTIGFAGVLASPSCPFRSLLARSPPSLPFSFSVSFSFSPFYLSPPPVVSCPSLCSFRPPFTPLSSSMIRLPASPAFAPRPGLSRPSRRSRRNTEQEYHSAPRLLLAGVLL